MKMSCVHLVTARGLVLSIIIVLASQGDHASTSAHSSDHVTTDAPSADGHSTSASPGALVADVEHDLRRSVYMLQLSVGYILSDIVIIDPTANETEILLELRDFLSNGTSAVYLQRNTAADLSANAYTLVLEFSRYTLGVDTQISLTDGLHHLNASGMVIVDFDTATVLENFLASTQDPCAAHNVCPLGFTCNPAGCRHMCNRESVCSGHGDCVVGVLPSAHISVSCQCHSGYFTHYSGDHCQNSRIGDDQVIAIVAGVLGTFCLLLVITLTFVCLSRKSKSRYILSREVYSNSTYDHSAAKK